MAPHPIHWIYRLTFNFFEPFMALSGAIQIHFAAPSYLAIANPNIKYDPSLQPLFTSILGGWLVVAFNSAVLLRVYHRDTKLWWYILFAHFISDTAYVYAVYQDLGADKFFDPTLWHGFDWLTIGTTILPMLVKVAYLVGIGVDFSERFHQRDQKIS